MELTYFGLLDRAEVLDTLRNKWARNYLTDDQAEQFAINRILETPDKYKDLIKSNRFTPAGGMASYKYQLLVAPGNGYSAAIEAILLQLLFCPDNLTVLLSSGDTFTRKFVGYISTAYSVIIPELSHEERIEMVKDLKQMWGVAVLYGSDETIQKYKDVLHPQTVVHAYGSKTSIGVHAGLSTLMKNVDKYAEDMFVYGGNGCLNTSVLYVRSTDRGTIRRLQDFAERLSQFRESYIDSQHLTYSLSKQRMAFMRDTPEDLEVWEHSGVFIRRSYCSVPESIRTGYGNGTVVLVPYEHLDEIISEWTPTRVLSSVTTDLPMSDFPTSFRDGLVDLGVSRFTEVGQAQRPNPTWRHDGLPVVPLLWKEFEVEQF